MNDEINSFYEKYRDYLDSQRDTSFQAIDNARRNAYQNIMSSANTAGMMYSNFPERAKYQYDTNYYDPARAKVQNSYQTGLSGLFNNMTGIINGIRDLEDAAKAANDATAAATSNKSAINNAGDYRFWGYNTGTTQFKNANDEPIRFGTAAKRYGLSGDPNEVLDYASKTLYGDDEFNFLKSAWDRAKAAGYTGFDWNVGDTYEVPTYNFLDESEKDFLGSLGLKFK